MSTHVLAGAQYRKELRAREDTERLNLSKDGLSRTLACVSGSKFQIYLQPVLNLIIRHQLLLILKSFLIQIKSQITVRKS